MTQNQIAFYNAVENVRHNKATEFETNRSNVARETETHRSNVAVETETHRHNVVTENETTRHNKVSEAIGWHQAQSQRINANANMMNAKTNRMVGLSQIKLNESTISLQTSQKRLNVANTNLTNARRVAQDYSNEITSKTKDTLISATNKKNAYTDWYYNVDSSGNSLSRSDAYSSSVSGWTGVAGSLLSGAQKGKDLGKEIYNYHLSQPQW